MSGRPDLILTDNGPQYTGQAFKAFTETWGITHVTSSPHYVRSNGLAERYVRYIKATLKKSSDMQLALLNIRATPVDAKLPSPAEMLLGRPLATLLQSRSEPGMENHRDRMQERQTEMKDQHDKTSRTEDLPSLYTGQAVRILHHQKKTWCPGKIVSKCNEPRSYVMETPNGTRLRRNRAHLRELVASPAKTVRFSDEPAYARCRFFSSMFLVMREGGQLNERSSELLISGTYNECEHLCELIMNANTDVIGVNTTTFGRKFALFQHHPAFPLFT